MMLFDSIGILALAVHDDFLRIVRRVPYAVCTKTCLQW